MEKRFYRYIRRIIIKGLFFYDIFNPIAQDFNMRIWGLRGKPFPPPQRFKQHTVIDYARRFGIDTFVETGTYLGDMVSAVKDVFKQIYSIELARDLYERAKKKFRDCKNIRLVHGDSGKMLPVLLDHIDGPCLFWLDAHYSGSLTVRGEVDTPIEKELSAIMDHPVQDHVILIDDVHDFNGMNYYPKLEDLRMGLMVKRPQWVFETKEDIIRFHPRQCSWRTETEVYPWQPINS